MQTSIALLNSSRSPLAEAALSDTREPFHHPLLASLSNLSDRSKSHVLSKNRLAQVGKEYGLQEVLRWKPKKADNLSGSGIELVMAQAMYAIVGAVSLERGGVVADRIVKERILRQLGLDAVEDRRL
jgi:large subunit ribosomal protein L15